MAKSIKVLGTGCTNCKTTSALIHEVVNEFKIDASIAKIEDIVEIMEYDILATPAIVIDEVVAFYGRVPSKSEVIELLT
jgi:small redox-active disulfide protein 2